MQIRKYIVIIIVAKNILPFLILGAGLVVVGWVVYKMFNSKKDEPVPHIVPVHTPALPIHTPRVVDTTGTFSSAAHKARYSNQYLRRNLF
jgi:hypothetical protein